MYKKRLHTREYRQEIRELMCNEMKLKQDAVMNVSSNEVIGFTEDFVNKTKLLKSC